MSVFTKNAKWNFHFTKGKELLIPDLIFLLAHMVKYIDIYDMKNSVHEKRKLEIFFDFCSFLSFLYPFDSISGENNLWHEKTYIVIVHRHI